MATVRVENNKLIIEVPLQSPTPSSTGKTLVVATTNGFLSTTAEIHGKPVKVSVNAFIPK